MLDSNWTQLPGAAGNIYIHGAAGNIYTLFFSSD